MIAEEKKWQAHGDAHTLAESKIINKDPDRLSAAENAAEDMAKEQREQAKAMEAVAERKKGGGIAKNTSDKMFPNTKDVI